MYVTSAPGSQRMTASPTATSIGEPIAPVGTVISMGSIEGPCSARVPRPRRLDQKRSPETESPSRNAKSAAVWPLLRHRDTVTVHHDLDFRACAMAPIADRFPLRNQPRGRPDAYLASGPNVKTVFGPGVQNTRAWKPPLHEGVHPLPGQPVSLASTAKRTEPVAGDLGSEVAERGDVGR
jgi:hypothetical protein